MGLGAMLARPASAPAEMRTAGSTLEGVLIDFRNRYGFSPWQASTYRGFMSVPGAWRASLLLSDLFAQMPFHSYRSVPGGDGEVRTPRNAPVLESPAGSFEDPTTVFAAWGLDYLWDGNCVGLYTHWGAAGLPDAILPIPVCDVGVRIQPEVLNGVLNPWAGRKLYSINGVEYDQDLVFHVKGPCSPGAVRGMGVLETQLGALSLARDLEAQADSISLHGVPTGLLKSTNPEADPDDLTAAKLRWIENQRTRTVQALGPSIDFEPLSWNPEQLQLVESRKFSLSQLELMFGLPVGWLGGESNPRTYSNIEQDAVNLVKFSSLAGLVARFESMFTRKTLPRGQSAKANRDAVLRSDTITRYTAHGLALNKAPWKTVDEVRATENLPPLPDGQGATVPKPAPAPQQQGGAGTDTTDNNSPEGGQE